MSTGGQSIPDSKVEVQLQVIVNHDGSLNDLKTAPRSWQGAGAIEIRGTTSAGFAKKSYTLETRDALGNDLDVPLVGLPSESDWVLYGPYSDKTFIRNVLTYKLGRQLGNYQPRTQYIELFIDDDYQGVYVLTEKIKRGKQRVDIAKLPPTSTGLDGGYMFRREFKPVKPHWSSVIDTVWYYHYPRAKVISEQQRNYLRDFVNEFEVAMMAIEPSTSLAELSRWLDVPVGVDFVVMQELSRNVDSYKKSFYASKRSDAAGGQVVVGPLWDFNVAWGNIDYYDASNTAGLVLPSFGPLLEGTDVYPPWWKKLMANDTFTAELRCRWNELRKGVLSDAAMNRVIDDQVLLLEPVRERDDDRWHTIGRYLWPNDTVEETWQDEVTRLRKWASSRAAWLDQNMPGTCL